MKFGLVMRAYAPFEWFGLVYHGDGRGPTTSSEVTSRVKAWVVFDPISGAVGYLHAFRGNPLMPKAPNIDVHVAITAKVDGGRLDLHAELSGDQFPDVEIMLQDEAFERRMLATYETSGSAHLGPGRLSGNAARPMNAICKTFPLSSAGHFA